MAKIETQWHSFDTLANHVLLIIHACLVSPRCLLGLLHADLSPILQSLVLLSLLPTSFSRSRHVFISGSSARAADRLARVASAAQAPEHRVQAAGQHVMVRPGLEEGICHSGDLRPYAMGTAQLQALWRSCGPQPLGHTDRHRLESRGSPRAELQVAHRTSGAEMM